MSDMQRIRDLEREVRELRQRTAHLPTRVRGGSGGGGGGGGGWAPIVKPTREELPATDVPPGALGYVTGGTYAGGWFSYHGGWRGLNFWEAPEEEEEEE